MPQKQTASSSNSVKPGFYKATYKRPEGITSGSDADFEAFRSHLLNRLWAKWTGMEDLDGMIASELRQKPDLKPVVDRLYGRGNYASE